MGETDALTPRGHTHELCQGGPGRAGRAEDLPLDSPESPATSAVLSGEHRFPCLLGPCSRSVFLLALWPPCACGSELASSHSPRTPQAFSFQSSLLSMLLKPTPSPEFIIFFLFHPVAHGHLHPISLPSTPPCTSLRKGEVWVCVLSPSLLKTCGVYLRRYISGTWSSNCCRGLGDREPSVRPGNLHRI